MVGPKSIQTRVVGIITDEMHPYILFSSNGVSMKNVPLNTSDSHVVRGRYWWCYNYVIIHIIIMWVDSSTWSIPYQYCQSLSYTRGAGDKMQQYLRWQHRSTHIYNMLYLKLMIINFAGTFFCNYGLFGLKLISINNSLHINPGP